MTARIAEEVKSAIRAEYAEGLLGYGKLGLKYGVSKHGVAYIINPKPEREASKLYARVRRTDPDVRAYNVEYCRQWRGEDPEWTREYERNRYAASPAKRLSVLSWQQANPGKRRQTRHKYEARCRAAEGDGFTFEQWQLVVEVGWENCCAYCDRAFDETCPDTVDHVVPLASGGSHNPSNLVPACFSCNSSKSNRSLDVWRDGAHVDVTEFARQIAEALCLL